MNPYDWLSESDRHELAAALKLYLETGGDRCSGRSLDASTAHPSSSALVPMRRLPLSMYPGLLPREAKVTVDPAVYFLCPTDARLRWSMLQSGEALIAEARTAHRDSARKPALPSGVAARIGATREVAALAISVLRLLPTIWTRRQRKLKGVPHDHAS